MTILERGGLGVVSFVEGVIVLFTSWFNKWPSLELKYLTWVSLREQGRKKKK